MRSSSTTSSISAPPSSNGGDGGGVDRDTERSMWLQAATNALPVVHTGFTTSEDSSCSQHDLYATGCDTLQQRRVVHTGFTTSEDTTSSRSASSQQGRTAVRGGAVVHTGFTTSEDSGSCASSRSASFQVANAATHTSQTNVHTGFTTSESSAGYAPSSTSRSSTAALFAKAHRPAAAPVTKTDTAVTVAAASLPTEGPTQIRSAHATVRQTNDQTNLLASSGQPPPAAGPLEQPRKADATPRRKVSPVLGGGGSHRTQAAAHFLQTSTSAQQDAGNALGRRYGPPPPSQHHRRQGIEHLHVALPPSTLIDTQMRLDVLSDVALRVREEELQKELRRTRGEMQRRRDAATRASVAAAHRGIGEDGFGPPLTEQDDAAGGTSDAMVWEDSFRSQAMPRGPGALGAGGDHPSNWGGGNSSHAKEHDRSYRPPGHVQPSAALPTPYDAHASHQYRPRHAAEGFDQNDPHQRDEAAGAHRYAASHWTPPPSSSLHHTTEGRHSHQQRWQNRDDGAVQHYGDSSLQTPSGRGGAATPSSPTASRLRTYAQHLINLATTPHAKQRHASTPTRGGYQPYAPAAALNEAAGSGSSLSPLLKSPSPQTSDGRGPFNVPRLSHSASSRQGTERVAYPTRMEVEGMRGATGSQQLRSTTPLPSSQQGNHRDANASAALWSELTALRRIRET